MADADDDPNVVNGDVDDPGDNQVPMECPVHGKYIWHIYDVATFLCPGCCADEPEPSDP